MNIECLEKNRNLIVKINGEIDHHTANKIKSEIEKEFLKNKSKNIIFDFSKVRFMDSSGIGIIIGRYKELKIMGGKVFAINISPEINRIFVLSGLKRIIPCIESIENIEEIGN